MKNKAFDVPKNKFSMSSILFIKIWLHHKNKLVRSQLNHKYMLYLFWKLKKFVDLLQDMRKELKTKMKIKIQ